MPVLSASTKANGFMVPVLGLGTIGLLGSKTTVVSSPRPITPGGISREDLGDDGIVNKVINDFLATKSGDNIIGISHNQPNANSTITV